MRTRPTTRSSIWRECQPQVNGCVYWVGPVDREGYGKWHTGQGAHRVIFQRLSTSILPNLVVDHVCHSHDLDCVGGPACLHRRCVNLLHLQLVPERVNLLRGRSFSAVNARKTKCDNGHPYDESNTYVLQLKRGFRRGCRACNRAAVAAYKARRAAAAAGGGEGMAA